LDEPALSAPIGGLLGLFRRLLARSSSIGAHTSRSTAAAVPTSRWGNCPRKGRHMGIKLDDARRLIAAAEKKAAQIGQPMNIAVCDEGGNLVSHVRMDGAWLGSIDISI